jgi:hypothetical protein
MKSWVLSQSMDRCQIHYALTDADETWDVWFSVVGERIRTWCLAGNGVLPNFDRNPPAT